MYGTVRPPAVTNSRLAWRTSPVRSASGPTMIPGVSHRNTIGRSWASHSCMKRAALSAASLSMAPARCWGSLAMTPTARPSMRASAVTIPSPNPRRSSSTESVSNMVAITSRTSYTRSRFSGMARRSHRWSAQSQSSRCGSVKYAR